MSEKDANRMIIVGQVADKKLTVKNAAMQLNLSTRQIKRMVKRVRLSGPISVPHQGKGRLSHRRYPVPVIAQALHLIKTKYHDFGPTLAAEKLSAIDGVKVSNEWLRKIMIQHGLWKAKQKKVKLH